MADTALKGENISFGYGDTLVIDDLSFQLGLGEKVAVLGESGCGKSSLLYLMSGLKKPKSGRVLFQSTDLWSEKSDRAKLRRDHFGFIFQQHFLVNYLTVMENLLFCAVGPQSDQGKGMELLDYLGIADYASRLPHELSGGQRQRAAVARALMNSPKVVFADEPTASLDESNSDAVLSLLIDSVSQSDASLLFVTHDSRLVDAFDRVLCFPLSGGVRVD